MTIHTRIATVADLDALAGLFDAYRQFYEQAPDLEAARNFIQARFELNESEILVAENEACQPVGFCQMYPSFCSIEAKRIYILSDLFVSPEARRLGAGRALLVAAEKHASQTGRVKMELTTARTNKTAQSVYESLGWELDKVFLGYSKWVVADESIEFQTPDVEDIDLTKEAKLKMSIGHLIAAWDIFSNKLSGSDLLDSLSEEEKTAIWALEDLFERTLLENGVSSRPEPEWNRLVQAAKHHVRTIPVDYLGVTTPPKTG